GYHRGNYPSPTFGLRTELELGKGRNFVMPDNCAEWLGKTKTPPANVKTSDYEWRLKKFRKCFSPKKLRRFLRDVTKG
ncbi:unnamed protein product, partial [Amoebophrya sp. A25]